MANPRVTTSHIGSRHRLGGLPSHLSPLKLFRKYLSGLSGFGSQSRLTIYRDNSLLKTARLVSTGASLQLLSKPVVVKFSIR
jgi:hypothetical protein